MIRISAETSFAATIIPLCLLVSLNLFSSEVRPAAVRPVAIIPRTTQQVYFDFHQNFYLLSSDFWKVKSPAQFTKCLKTKEQSFSLKRDACLVQLILKYLGAPLRKE